MTFLELIHARRSVRLFTEEAVAESQILQGSRKSTTDSEPKN